MGLRGFYSRLSNALPRAGAHSSALIAIILGVFLTSGCQRAHGPVGAAEKKASDAAANGPPPRVNVMEVREEIWPLTVPVQGSLLGDERSTIGAKLAGRVDEVLVDLGSKVAKGDKLVLLDQRDLELHVLQAEAQLSQACAAIGILPHESEAKLDREKAPPVQIERAMLNEAKAAYDRGNHLSARNVITTSEVETLEAQYKAAQARYQSSLNNVAQLIALVGVRRAELAIARQQLSDSVIVAPFDGVVDIKHVAPGEYVQLGTPLVSLIRTGKLRFTAGVPEMRATMIKPGQTIIIRPSGRSSAVQAEITRVSPSVSLSSRAVLIEADVPNESHHWQAGLFAEADIIIDPAAATLSVPISALKEFAGINKVWIVRNNSAIEQPVRIGRREVERAEILEGLKPGDLVISNSMAGKTGSVIAVRSAMPTGAATALPNKKTSSIE